MGKITVNELSSNLRNLVTKAGNNIDNKQDMSDNSLNTGDKTVVGAINELNNAIGTLETLLGDINNILDDDASNLAGVLDSLLNGYYNISGILPGSNSGVDINSPDIYTEGELSEGDIYASHNKSYATKTSDEPIVLYSCTMPNIKYGKYAICLRMKIDVTSKQDLFKLIILDGDTQVYSQTINGSVFANADNYQYIYTTFTYDSTGKARDVLTFKLETVATTTPVELRFDYAYFNMIMPSVFL